MMNGNKQEIDLLALVFPTYFFDSSLSDRYTSSEIGPHVGCPNHSVF